MIGRQAVVLAFERPAARAHLVGHRAGRIDVGAPIDRLAAQLLGRRVMRRPHHHAGGGQGFRRGHAREAEVHQLDLAARQDPDIAWLDVAVHHALAVGVFERVEDLDQRADAFLEIQPAAVEDLGEVFALEVLHHHVHGAVDLAGFVHGDDVGVVEARARLRLAHETIEVIRIRDIGAHGLDGDDALQRRVDRLVDFAHAAAAEDRLDAETADALRRHGSRRHFLPLTSIGSCLEITGGVASYPDRMRRGNHGQGMIAVHGRAHVGIS